MQIRKNCGNEKLYFYNYGYFYSEDCLYIESMGETFPCPDYFVERNRFGVSTLLTMFVFEYVISGKGYIECEGEKFSVEAGDCYVLGNHKSHMYYSDKETPLHKIWINVRGPFIDTVLKLYKLNQPVVICKINALPLFLEMKHIMENPSMEYDMQSDAVAVKLTELILLIYRTGTSGLCRSSSLAKIKRHIDLSIRFDESVEDIARAFYINPSYMIACFKKEYGLTPKQYMLRRKMEAAKQLLAESETEIKDIAATLGFSSVYHFSNTFKALTGISPNVYRQEKDTKKQIET